MEAWCRIRIPVKACILARLFSAVWETCHLAYKEAKAGTEVIFHMIAITLQASE